MAILEVKENLHRAKIRESSWEDKKFLLVGELEKMIPVFDFRNLSSHEEIAGRLAKGEQMAFFGGVWGGFKGVKQATVNEGFFTRVKPGRPKEAKIATMMGPEQSIGLIDWSKVHKDFRFLQDHWEYKKLWESHNAFLHIIAPIREPLDYIPDIFKTTPEDFKARYPKLESLNSTTACFVWRNDPYLKHLSNFVKRLSHTNVFIGVSTLNRHGEEPPYSYEELIDQLNDGRTNPADINLIVRDRLYEEYEALGSHTQLRLPLEGEQPKLKVIRIGSLSPEGFAKATGFDFEILPDIKDVRKNPGENLDKLLFYMKEEINQNWESEKPLIYFRN
ncbi:MAG TPA: hypothetical protein VIK81_01485 [Patescibacteria group bacterium]